MDWIAEYPELDHRKNTQRGFDPEVYIIATIFSGCSGEPACLLSKNPPPTKLSSNFSA
ncbi:MAG: hypothetical protein P1U90_17785 [Akkermansiaceae bacterium]|nr:hypothetical protein [Akkermansiaceae bacterium]